jgi:hypothetical protein
MVVVYQYTQSGALRYTPAVREMGPLFGRRKSTGQRCEPCWLEYQAEVPASWRVTFACAAGHAGEWALCDDHKLVHDAAMVVPGYEPECPDQGCMEYMSAEDISFEQLASR